MKREPDFSKGVLDSRTGMMISYDVLSRRRARKVARRKGRYLPGWEDRTSSNRSALNRKLRRQVRNELRIQRVARVARSF